MATQTIPPDSATANWLAERNHFIGGSEVYELLNERQYGRGCHTALAFKKLGVEPDYPEQRDADDEALLRRGHILEPIAAQLYEEETGRKVRRAPMDASGFPKAQISKQYPWAGVHTDRTILRGHGGVTETTDMEIKTRNEGPFLRVLRSGPFPGDLLQPQWANFVTGRRRAVLAMLGVFGGLPLKHFESQRDEELIERHFKPAGDKFANAVWGKGRVPEPVIAADDPRCKVCEWRMTCRGEAVDQAAVEAQRAISAGKSELVQISDPAVAQALTERELLKQEVNALDARLEEYDATILMALGDVHGAYVAGFGKAYALDSRSPERLDAHRLKAEKPEVYQQYVVPGKLTGEKFLRVYPAR